MMKTVYGKLTALILGMLLFLLLFMPLNSGLEDRLYVWPRSIIMQRGDSYDIVTTLDSDRPQRIEYASLDKNVAEVTDDGRVIAISSGATDIHISAEGGSKARMHVEVEGTPTTVLVLNTDELRMEKHQVSGLTARLNDGAEDTRIEWISLNNNIASVDASGRVTALRGGQTRIYALTPNGLNAAADVYVHVSGNAVRIEPEALTVGTGASLKMGVSYFPDDATDPVSRWVTSDPRLMTVDADGTIHARGIGQAVLTVFTQDNLSSSMVINIEQSADRFDLSPSAATLERGSALDLEARFLDASGAVDTNANEHYIAWHSSDPSVATVDEHGHVEALRSGLTRISAVADGMTAMCDLRVQVLVHEVTLNEHEINLLRKDTVNPIQLSAIISPADPDDPSITYETSNDLIARVDQNGLVTLTGAYGTAIITARAASGAEDHAAINILTQMPASDAETPDADTAG